MYIFNFPRLRSRWWVLMNLNEYLISVSPYHLNRINLGLTSISGTFLFAPWMLNIATLLQQLKITTNWFLTQTLLSFEFKEALLAEIGDRGLYLTLDLLLLWPDFSGKGRLEVANPSTTLNRVLKRSILSLGFVQSFHSNLSCPIFRISPILLLSPQIMSNSMFGLVCAQVSDWLPGLFWWGQGSTTMAGERIWFTFTISWTRIWLF